MIAGGGREKLDGNVDLVDFFGSLAVAVGIFLLLANADAAAVWVLERTVEPAARWLQRVLLGIDAPRAGPHGVLGARGVAERDFEPCPDGRYRGLVAVAGERWSARAVVPIARGAQVRVEARAGTFLVVVPARD